jgi:hypothetical protein
MSLVERLIYNALVASEAGKTEVALALFRIVAEHFDWSNQREIELETNGKGMA